jgi:hypothetical protein
MAFDEVDGAHKPFHSEIDDDGSTSAGSSDIESEGTGSSQFYLSPTFPQHVSAPPGLASPLGEELGFEPLERFAAPPGLTAPEAFPPPPGLLPPGLAPPPGLIGDLPEPEPFNPKKFRRELVSVLKDLAQNKNVAAAVRRVRAQQVPVDRQAAETMDILTRAAEENRGNPRRLYFAFVAGLARGNPSAFEQAEVLSGIKTFFKDIYVDLCEEVPRLPAMIEAELVPTLREVFTVETVESLLPSGFKVA